MNVQATTALVAQSEEVATIALPVEDNLPAAFAKPNGIEELVKQVETAARAAAQNPDLTTQKGRDAIVSLAYKVTQSKTAIDKTGGDLNADRLAENKKVNDLRNLAKERLTALADEIRKPLTDWEAAEETRTTAHKDAIQDIGMAGINEHSSVEVIAVALSDLEAIDVSADRLEEYAEFAASAKEATAARLNAALIVAKDREDAAAELDKFRKEAAARAEQDAAREAAEAQRRADEQAAADAKAAEQQAIIDKMQADAKAAQDAAQAKIDEANERAAKIERDAAQAEADRLLKIAEAEAAEEKRKQDALDLAEAEERKQRESDEAATRQIAEAQAKAEQDEATAEAIAHAIWMVMDGDEMKARPAVADRIAASIIACEIPHVGVTS